MTTVQLTNTWQGQLALAFGYQPEAEATDASNRRSVASSLDEPDPGLANGPGFGKTLLIKSHGIAPLKVQRPFYPEGDRVCHSVIVHTAGGMVGGDRLDLDLSLEPSAHALVTTAAASKAYKSNGYPVHQTIHMTVESEGCLEWFPQPLIVFNGAQYDQQIRVDLAPGAIWMGWDITRLGRTIRGERFDEGWWRSRLEIWQNGIPLWIDPQWIQGGSGMLTSSHGLNHCPVIGTFAFVGVEVSDDLIAQLRVTQGNISQGNISQGNISQASAQINSPQASAQSPSPSPSPSPSSSIGISQLQSGVVCRYRGHSTIEAQRWFMAIWHLVRQSHLGRPRCIPRVWQYRSFD